jgi:hypothetical protein
MSKSDSCDDKMNIEEILHSLDNDKNLSISKLTYDKINNMKYNMLQRLGMNDEELESMLLKLGDYRYVEELQDIQHGAFIRYIPLTSKNNRNRNENEGDNGDNSDIILKNGGFICDIKILGSGVHLLCRNHFRKIFQLKLDEVLIFQKLSNQEEIILSVFDYLAKNK